MERYWVYLDNKVQGPVEIPSLRTLTGFTLLTQVCPEGQASWTMADDVIEIKAYFAAPPRASSLAPQLQELPMEKPQLEMVMPSTAVADPLVETLPDQSDLTVNTSGNAVPAVAAETNGLRIACGTCGYKNPRDVSGCMKCGASVKAALAANAAAGQKPTITLNPLTELPTKPAEEPAPARFAPPETRNISSPTVDIPVARIALIVGGLALAGAIFFAARHLWKAKHRVHVPLHPVVVQTPPVSTSISKKTHHERAVRQQATRQKHAAAPILSGVPSEPAEERVSEQRPAAAPRRTAPAPVESNPAESTSKVSEPTASYTVLNEAYPLKHRQPAPIDSKYAVKRRGNSGLWADREQDALQQVFSKRIYGGQRTIRRNAEILMQILRDREYTTAFETGKRIYLFNDADWVAMPKTGPSYEIRLTFSGGKEADGSPRAPLKFAFVADLERQTVEPGGDGLIKSNTMHAFFDESRIPPEERRSVAKDTGELVQAAQPGASPLALDTISKHYAATYSFPALQRVADAFGLTIVNKKLARETASVRDLLPDSQRPVLKESRGVETPKMQVAPSASGAIQYVMERGVGHDRVVTAKAPSSASPAKLWETVTSYDRLVQYVPDVLVSQREGQDGTAIIVHTVFLSRVMFFVFKVNLHMRVIEHPQQHRLEFERIAGDFEKFNGYLDISADPTGNRSTLELHLTMAPKGFMPQWALRGMAQNFLVPVLDALRSKAEAN